LKDAETRVLLEGIRLAAQGAVMYHSSASGKALAQAMQTGKDLTPPPAHALALWEPLTEREHEVLQEMAFGLRNADIARLLGVSEGTIKTHVHRILQKFGVEDRTQAVVMAIRQHLVQ